MAKKAKPHGKRGRKPPPPGETSRDRFVRVGNARMIKAINAIGLIGNLASPHYGWTPEDLDAMHEALLKAIDRAFAQFEAKQARQPPDFRLN